MTQSIRHKQWCQEHPESCTESRHKYYLKNQDELKKNMKEYRKTHLEQCRKTGRDSKKKCDTVRKELKRFRMILFEI